MGRRYPAEWRAPKQQEKQIRLVLLCSRVENIIAEKCSPQGSGLRAARNRSQRQGGDYPQPRYSSRAQKLRARRHLAAKKESFCSMASQVPRSLAAHNTPGPFWGGPAPTPPPPRPAPAPKPTQPKPTQPTLRLDPSLKRLHDELVAQKADPSILKDWTTEKRKDGPNRGDRIYYVDPRGKAHRSAPAARRAILNTGPATPAKKRKTQDKDRSQLVKWKLSGCTVAVTPAPPRTEANESELAMEGKVFEDEGVRWRIDEVYFDEDVKALCASYYDFDARGFVPPDDEDADLGVPRCCGAFTPSTRLASI